jgi:hypothetical protein
MPILFTCSSCGKQLSVPDEYGGQQGVCPSCGSPVTVPQPSAAQPPSTHQPPPATAAPQTFGPAPQPPPAAAQAGAPPAPPQPVVGRPTYATVGGVAPTAPTHQLAIWSLVLGIVGFAMCGPITSLPGLIVGIVARSKIRDSRGAYGGEGMALAGIIISAINLGLTVIFVVLYAIIFAVAAVSTV